MTAAAFEHAVLSVAETAEVEVVHVWAAVITQSIVTRLHSLGCRFTRTTRMTLRQSIGQWPSVLTVYPRARSDLR